MLRIPDPAQALLFGLRITHELLRGHGSPAVRVVFHHGSAIERDGDYFGAAVNLAARVAAVANGGEVLLTAHTAALAPALEGIFYRPRGRQTLRNIRKPLELFAAIPQDQPVHGKLSIDPVCQMAVDPEHAAGRLIFEDTPTSSARWPAPPSSLSTPNASSADPAHADRARWPPLVRPGTRRYVGSAACGVLAARQEQGSIPPNGASTNSPEAGPCPAAGPRLRCLCIVTD
jgi:hypothetical protein